VNLDDTLKQLSEEVRDGAIEALHLRHIGNVDEAKELEEEVAHYRREHRRLILKGYYDQTGSVSPEVGDVLFDKTLKQRAADRIEAKLRALYDSPDVAEVA
jgi:hypothetical protein